MKATQIAWALGFVLLLVFLIVGGAVMYNYGYESGYQSKAGGGPSTFYGQSSAKVYEKKSTVAEQGNGQDDRLGSQDSSQDAAYSYVNGRDGQSSQYQSSQSQPSQNQDQAESRSRYGSSYSASRGFSYSPSYGYRPRYYRYYPYYYSYYPPQPFYYAYGYPNYRYPYSYMHYPYYHRPYYLW